MNPIHIQFQRGRGGFTAKFPCRLPELKQLCYCVPALVEPGRGPALMLCDEQQHLAWQREVALLDQQLMRMALMLQVQLEPSCTHLCIPERLLVFAGIQGPTQLQVLGNGTALLTPDP